MTDIIRCPDCGHPNPTGSESCAACNYPLGQSAASPRAGSGPSADPVIPPPRRRPPRNRPMPAQSAGLWVMFAVIAAVVVIWIAITGRHTSPPPPPVEGSSADQQALVDQYLHALEHDSTDVEAHQGLADVLFDTGNWNQAIVHYDRVLAADSSRVGAIVDLGVCYYNTGRSARAEDLFRLALTRDPHHPVALFNLGIVYEQRKDYAASLRYFHQLLESNPPETMRESVVQAMQRVQQAGGGAAPPIQDAGK